MATPGFLPALPALVNKLYSLDPPTQSGSVKAGDLELIRATVYLVNNTNDILPTNPGPWTLAGDFGAALANPFTTGPFASGPANMLGIQMHAASNSLTGMQTGSTVQVSGIPSSSPYFPINNTNQKIVMVTDGDGNPVGAGALIGLLDVAYVGGASLTGLTIKPVPIQAHSAHALVRASEFFNLRWIGDPPGQGQNFALSQPPSLYLIGALSQFSLYGWQNLPLLSPWISGTPAAQMLITPNSVQLRGIAEAVWTTFPPYSSPIVQFANGIGFAPGSTVLPAYDYPGQSRGVTFFFYSNTGGTITHSGAMGYQLSGPPNQGRLFPIVGDWAVTAGGTIQFNLDGVSFYTS